MADRILALWCSQWPLAPCGADLTPAIVIESQRVVAASSHAQADGVEIGQRQREAQRRSPQAVCIERDRPGEVRVFDRVVQRLYDTAPAIDIVRPGVCQFPSRGPTRYFNSERYLAQRVIEEVSAVVPHQVNLGCGVGIADSSFAARLAARQSAACGEPILVEETMHQAFIGSASVMALGYRDLTIVLQHLGLHHIGDFAALPRADVVARFGDLGERAHRVANGEELQPMGLTMLEHGIEVKRECDPPLITTMQAAFWARAMAEELQQVLASRGCVAQGLVMTATAHNGEVIERRWRDEGALTDQEIAQRFRWQLEAWAENRAARNEDSALASLSLAPLQLGPDAGRQQYLWGGSASRAHQVHQGVARLRSLVGDDNVRVPTPTGGRSPEEQFSLFPVHRIELNAEGEFAVPPVRAEPWPGRLDPPHPTVVYSDPPSVYLADDAGCLVRVTGDGRCASPPSVLWMGEHRWQIVGWGGPWVSRERWWDPDRSRRRARLQVVLDNGTAFLLACEHQQWRVEAAYD